MKGFKASTQKPYPNYTDVYRLLSELEVYSFYISNLELNTKIVSPIGEKDNNPSFSVFWSFRKHKYLFKEFRYGYTGDCIDFVRYYFMYPDNTTACMRILRDFGLDSDFHIDDQILKIQPTGLSAKSLKTRKPKRRKASIKIVTRDWMKHDIEYWLTYGIDRKWLNYGSVYPISYYYINNKIAVADKYSYAYIEWKDSRITYKIYQPFNKADRKWVSNNNASVWELWDRLPQNHSFLIITKSRKDALSIMATARIPSTSLQAEGTIPKKHVVEQLKQRFKYVFLLYDNDFDSSENWGFKYSIKLSEEFGIDNIVIPEKLASKDYTNLIENYSIDTAVNFLWNEIKKRVIKYIFQNENKTN